MAPKPRAVTWGPLRPSWRVGSWGGAIAGGACEGAECGMGEGFRRGALSQPFVDKSFTLCTFLFVTDRDVEADLGFVIPVSLCAVLGAARLRGKTQPWPPIGQSPGGFPVARGALRYLSSRQSSNHSRCRPFRASLPLYKIACPPSPVISAPNNVNTAQPRPPQHPK